MCVAETLLLRVVITPTTLSIRRAWSHREIPLSELRSMQRIKGDYVLKRSRGLWIFVPSLITNHAGLIDRLQRAIAANLLQEVSGLSASQKRMAHQKLEEAPRRGGSG